MRNTKIVDFAPSRTKSGAALFFVSRRVLKVDFGVSIYAWGMGDRASDGFLLRYFQWKKREALPLGHSRVRRGNSDPPRQLAAEQDSALIAVTGCTLFGGQLHIPTLPQTERGGKSTSVLTCVVVGCT